MMEMEAFLMTKTQIQVPEELLEEVRAFAKRREWSLAEAFRGEPNFSFSLFQEIPCATSAA
jgi:hypothetical protein